MSLKKEAKFPNFAGTPQPTPLVNVNSSPDHLPSTPLPRLQRESTSTHVPEVSTVLFERDICHRTPPGSGHVSILVKKKCHFRTPPGRPLRIPRDQLPYPFQGFPTSILSPFPTPNTISQEPIPISSPNSAYFGLLASIWDYFARPISSTLPTPSRVEFSKIPRILDLGSNFPMSPIPHTPIPTPRAILGLPWILTSIKKAWDPPSTTPTFTPISTKFATGPNLWQGFNFAWLITLLSYTLATHTLFLRGVAFGKCVAHHLLTCNSRKGKLCRKIKLRYGRVLRKRGTLRRKTHYRRCDGSNGRSPVLKSPNYAGAFSFFQRICRRIINIFLRLSNLTLYLWELSVKGFLQFLRTFVSFLRPPANNLKHLSEMQMSPDNCAPKGSPPFGIPQAVLRRDYFQSWSATRARGGHGSRGSRLHFCEPLSNIQSKGDPDRDSPPPSYLLPPTL